MEWTIELEKIKKKKENTKEISAIAEEIIKNSLIDYCLDKKLFNIIPFLLSDDWKSYVFGVENYTNTLEIEDYSYDEKSYILKLQNLCPGNEDNGEVLNLLLSNINKVHFVKGDFLTDYCSTFCELKINEVTEKFRKGEEIYLLQ